jgi:orotidine-5'-phosphate decarboxylase
MSGADRRLIVALDHDDLDKALAMVDLIDELVDFYKVGLTLYTAAGPGAVKALKDRRKQVFLDLKLHDIPVQVAGAAAAAANLGVDLLTVHVAGGEAMMRAAASAVEATGVRLLGVTVLTSLEAPDGAPLRAAQAALAAGLDGVVAAPGEAAAIRRALGPNPLIVTPGIRLAPVSKDDQARTGDPRTALAAGANHLVVGRPITAEADPRRAAGAILAAMHG